MSSQNKPASLESQDVVIYNYRSQIAPRITTVSSNRAYGPLRNLVPTNFHQRSASLDTKEKTYSKTQVYSSSISLKPKSSAVKEIAESREREKQELSELNDKFASYLERVRFLEVHNKKLLLELDALKKRAGGESDKIRDMYKIEIQQAEKLIKDTNRDRVDPNLLEEGERLKKLYAKILNNHTLDKDRVFKLYKQISDNEAEINLLKRRLGDLEDEVQRYRAESNRLFDEKERLTGEVDSESLQRVELESERANLEEELNFMKRAHEQELNNLREKTIVDMGLDSSQFFKSELANAIKQIRIEFDQLNNNKRNELDQYFRTEILKIQKANKRDVPETQGNKTETLQLRAAVFDQRREIVNAKARNAELEARLKELEGLLLGEQKDGQSLISQKENELEELRRIQKLLHSDYSNLTKIRTSLEEEILTYRRLLEGDNDQNGLKQVVDIIEERAKQEMINAVSLVSSQQFDSSRSRFDSRNSSYRSSYELEFSLSNQGRTASSSSVF